MMIIKARTRGGLRVVSGLQDRGCFRAGICADMLLHLVRICRIRPRISGLGSPELGSPGFRAGANAWLASRILTPPFRRALAPSP
jgi:hypothetical protein